MSTNTTLTATQQNVLTHLRDDGSTYDKIADELDISKSTARDHVSSLRDAGVSIGDRFEDGRKIIYHRKAEQEHPVTEATSRYVKTSTKAQTTEHLNDQARQMERRLTELLAHSQPAVADGGLVQEPSHEDVVVHATDDHVGDVTSDEFGNVTYDIDIWKDRRTETMDTCFRIVDRQESAGYTFDTLHLLLGGDMVTGEGVYPGQEHNLEMTLDEQVNECATFYMTQIRRAAEKFETVQVVCNSGNHGQLKFSSASDGANADRLLYLMLDGMVRESELENVTFIRNDSTHFTNFDMRGHRGHLRHGDDALEHIGTSSGKRRWFNWRDKHQFDVAYRGHFHMYQRDTLTRTYEAAVRGENGKPVLKDEDEEEPEIVTEVRTENLPVIMSGSPKPPEEFEESIARWSQPCATIHGVSDERPVTWLFAVDFN